MEGIELIPKIIQPYFESTRQTTDGDNNIIEGALTCCNAHDFEVLVVGKIKHTLFSKMFLCPENERTVFKVRCKKCGKVISVFNSSCDGYGQCGKEFQSTCASPRPINCKKCQNGDFSVTIKYEYPNDHELQELEINDSDNAFTWIWIKIECNKCGTRYKNFVDCETT